MITQTKMNNEQITQILTNTNQIKGGLKGIEKKIETMSENFSNISQRIDVQEEKIRVIEKQQLIFKISLFVMGFFVFILYVNM